MKLLLDTHVAIWVLVAPELLSARVHALIAEAGTGAFVSAVSIWEIAIKHSLGKSDAPPFSGAEAVGYFREGGLSLLGVTPEHAAGVGNLPPIHRDPFDRLLVAQALAEPLRFVTHDRKLAAYSDTIITF